MNILYLNTVTSDFEYLSNELNKELQDVYGDAHDKYKQYNLLKDIKDIFICYHDSKPIGCCSIKYYSDKIYEIKRVIVLKEFRGKGISKMMMGELERKAKDMGINELILETGEKWVSAMNLYKKLGYNIIKNYGQYENMVESICMKKELI